MSGTRSIPWHWNSWPLKRLFLAITALVLLFLATVLALGIRQFLLYRQCNEAVEAGDRLLFQFTALKDHLNHSLILGEEVDLHSLDVDLQQMEKEAQGLAGNILVPEGMKAHLPSRVDLVGLEVRLRAIQGQRQEKIRETGELVRTLGSLNTGLQQFRFALGDHTQSILLGLHKIIVGALGMIVVLTCVLLYLVNTNLAAPILTLCRLTGERREGEANGDSRCSMDILTQRISRLLKENVVSRGAGGEPDSADSGWMEQEAIRYRYAITGCIGQELANELTNRINGIINYTQTLIDIGEKNGLCQQAAGLSRSLSQEATKTASLIAALQRAGQWQAARGPSSIALSTLFETVALLLDKPLRAESIILRLPTGCRGQVTVAAGDLWLVLLTLLEQGRRALNREVSKSQPEKWLSAECQVLAEVPHRIRLVLTNSVAAWEDGHSGPVWPTRAFCAHLLQLYQASIHLETITLGKRILIDLPCRDYSI